MLKRDGRAPDGYRAPGPGEIMKNPTLAHTFRRLAESGKEGFYTGDVAEAIVKVCKDRGGHLELEDLKRHMELGSEMVRSNFTSCFSVQNIKSELILLRSNLYLLNFMDRVFLVMRAVELRFGSIHQMVKASWL